ncbi:MAG TPA: hypothetical protein VGK45_09505 [Thermoanaerobaculia bacterium]
MFRKERKNLTAAVVAVLLMVPFGSAEAAGGRRSGLDLWSRLLGWMGSVWAAVQSDEGSGIDPDGRPQAVMTIDEGSSIDPNGRH